MRRVYEKAVQSKVGDVIVTTDSDEIINHCKKYKINTIKTSKSCESETDRVAEAFKLLKDNSYSNVINLQGDLPFIDEQNIRKVLFPLDFVYDVGTLIHPIPEEKIKNPNTVKAIVSFEQEIIIVDNIINYKIGRVHWFVRAAIQGVQHVGIYSFKSDTLQEISKLTPAHMKN